MAQIQLRRGTAAQWTTANPILALGEAGYETNTGLLKLGDGATAWNSLVYYPQGFSDLTYAPDSVDGGSASQGTVLLTLDGGSA